MTEALTVKVEVSDVLKDLVKGLQMIAEEMKIMDARIQILETAACKR